MRLPHIPSHQARQGISLWGLQTPSRGWETWGGKPGGQVQGEYPRPYTKVGGGSCRTLCPLPVPSPEAAGRDKAPSRPCGPSAPRPRPAPSQSSTWLRGLASPPRRGLPGRPAPPTFPQLRQWCFLRMTVKGALHAVQKLQASSGTHSGGSVPERGAQSGRGSDEGRVAGCIGVGYAGASGPGAPPPLPPVCSLPLDPTLAVVSGNWQHPLGGQSLQLWAVPIDQTPAAAGASPRTKDVAEAPPGRPSPKPLSASTHLAEPLGKGEG